MRRTPRRQEEVHGPPRVGLYDNGTGIAVGHGLEQIGEPAAVVTVDAGGVELHTGLAELKSGNRNPIEVYFATLRIHKNSVGELG